jgi:UDP-N-acetylmuramoylalanine--D-glutamate ligase
MEKTTLVLGLGSSGLAAAEFLLQQGVRVVGVDRDRALLSSCPRLQRLQTCGLCVQHDGDPIDWSSVERLVVSPGVARTHEIYRSALAKGITVTGEAELALPYFTKPLVAVTGTNGKTTVALLVEHILNAAGIKAKALGNVGVPLCSYLMQKGDERALVVELSSYQLETLCTPAFEAAVLLNITPDHLDRYAHMEEYAVFKCRLQYLLKGNAPFFVQQRAHLTFGHLLTAQNVRPFGLGGLCSENIECLLPLDYTEEKEHEWENALAAWFLCQPFSISKEQFCSALATFRKPPHRIEYICEREGVLFYDDSKGTNLDAVIQSVKAMKGPVILIAGGVDKGASYLLWREPFAGKVKKIVAIGQAAPKIYRELHPYFNVKCVETLLLAVQEAITDARQGDSVLLSPGCSSFDMFRDYAHRGEEFQRCVNIII